MPLRTGIIAATLFLLFSSVSNSLSAKTNTDNAFDYILWSGGRYSKDAKSVERDARWFKDLGFTHCFIGQCEAGSAGQKKHISGVTGDFLKYFSKYDLKAGLRLYFTRSPEELAEAMGCPVDDLSKKGIIWAKPVSAKKKKKKKKKVSNTVCPLNPVHQELIDFYRTNVGKLIDDYEKIDSGKTLKLFLIGTEMGWYFPKDAKNANPAALAAVYKVAEKDGVLKESDSDTLGKVKKWWSGPHDKGRDWHLREAMEAAILKRIPDADFMVDPIWAIKIVNGFGGDWTYISNDPKRIAANTMRLKGVTYPAPACQGVQLTRESWGGRIPHDALLEACLLALCSGTDKLYHWGIHTFEPGREDNLYYGMKIKRCPEGYPYFTAKQVKDWKAWAKCLFHNRSRMPMKHLWDSLDKKTKGSIEEALATSDLDLGDDDGMALDSALDKKTIKQIVSGLNLVLRQKGLYNQKALGRIQTCKRAQKLLQRLQSLEPLELAEFNRLLIEPLFSKQLVKSIGANANAYFMNQTEEPTILELKESLKYARTELEPALRSIGRLIRDRGFLFSTWKPMQPQIIMPSGIYGSFNDNLVTSMLVGHLPLQIAYSQKQRNMIIPDSKYIMVVKETESPETYALLKKASANGVVIFVPRGFTPPDGEQALAKTVEYEQPESVGKKHKKKLEPDLLRKFYHETAKKLRKTCHKAGFLPYFDSDNLDVIMQGYVYKKIPMLFVVNDKRTYRDMQVMEGRGLHNKVDFMVRDKGNIRVVNIADGQQMKLEKQDDGWHFTDTLEPVWYRIYAVLKDGQSLPSEVRPLPPATDIVSLNAQKVSEGVKLNWNVPFHDWVNSDLARYEIYRSENGGKAKLLADIHARILEGPGGVVLDYTDNTAEKGKKYSYTVQAVSPLKRKGKMSKPTAVQM